jgi:serpin B
MSSRISLAAIGVCGLATAAFLLAGCGDSSCGGNPLTAAETENRGNNEEAPERPAKVGKDVRDVAAGNNRFALDLYGKLAADEEGNLFFSPASISTALAMTYAGAEGATEKEMAETLHFELPEKQLHDAYKGWRSLLNTGGKKRGYELNIANRLWGQQGFGFRQEFLNTTDDRYGAKLAEVDYIRKTEESRVRINDWVEKETAGRIKDLIPRGVLDDMTRLVLTNAIYFKGDWTAPFDPKLTKKAPFHTSATSKVEAPLMYRKDHFGFREMDDLKVLELPYGKDKHLSMIVLLPKEKDGLAALEKKLSAKNLKEWTTGLRSADVKVWLPKFQTTSQFQMKDVLASLGMKTAFDPNRADFSGMSTSDKLSISQVVHKAFVEVNEKGTEAAAATGVVIGVTSAPAVQPEFRADHPFVFVIRDNRTEGVLFLGRIVDPTK